MKKKFLIVALVIMMFTACNQPDITSSSSTTPTSQPATPRPPTLDEEANKAAKEFWDNLLTKCDESTYWLESGSGMGTARVFEARGNMSMNVSGSAPPKKQLTKAEELNREGQPQEQWIGRSWIEFEAWRYGDYYDGNIYQWTRWQDKAADQKRQNLEEMKKYMPQSTYESMKATQQSQARLEMKRINNKWEIQAWGVTHSLQKIGCDKVSAVR